MSSTSPTKGITKNPPKKHGPKGAVKGAGKPGKGAKKAVHDPSTSTPQPDDIPIPVTIPVAANVNTPFFCCTNRLPSSSSFPPPLIPFYNFLLCNRDIPVTNPYPLATLPPTTTYFRFSHLSLATLQETHRYFLSLDPKGETPEFVEGAEEEVLDKAGALTQEDRKQDVMILSQNARCANHAPVGREGFWFVLMRVDGLE